MNANQHLFETRKTWMRRPDQVLNGGERQEEVRILIEKDEEGNVLNQSIEYSFGRQTFDECTEEWHNRIYQFLVERNWRVGAVSGTCKNGLSPKEVLTEGIAFKLAFSAACRDSSKIDAFLEKIDSEYPKDKDQLEKEYAGVIDLETLRDFLKKGGDEDGLAFSAACRESFKIDAFLKKIDSEYQKNKDQFEKDYIDVVDLETLRDVLMKGGPEDSGLGFKDVKDVEAGI